MADFRVSTLRELFRNLNTWKMLYESDGIDLLVAPDGTEWSLWDVDYLATDGLRYLSRRQSEAIRWYLVEGLREKDVAGLMGIAPNNPVGQYASNGIGVLLELMDAGQLPRFKSDTRWAA